MVRQEAEKLTTASWLSDGWVQLLGTASEASIFRKAFAGSGWRLTLKRVATDSGYPEITFHRESA